MHQTTRHTSYHKTSHPSSIGLTLACLFLVSLLLTGCEEVLNTILDNPVPVGLEATDGEYKDRIEVSWTEPSLTSDKWEGYEITGYDISWSAGGDVSGFFHTDSTSHSIEVLVGNRARLYNIEVTTIVEGPGGESEEASSSDTGFALETQELLWYDGGREYSCAGNDAWYVTMLQEGFSYSFAFDGGETGFVEFYRYKTLEPLLATTDSGTTPSWKCSGGGDWNKYYVRVVPSSPGTTFRAAYGF